jgi:quercetin dioxygenase-like cupin family protein
LTTSQPQPAHEDDRGTITDLITEPVDAVTCVRTKQGAVRGNHLHKQTRQWAYVVSGRLFVSTGDEVTIAGAGQMVENEPGEPHAWRALEDTTCIVFVQGPRAGGDYESDTYRLAEPLIR